MQQWARARQKLFDLAKISADADDAEQTLDQTSNLGKIFQDGLIQKSNKGILFCYLVFFQHSILVQ